MNSNTTKKPNKFIRFLRNNAALLLLIFCVLAIAAVVLAVTLTRDTPIIPDDPVVNNPSDDTPGDDTPTTPKTEIVQVFFVAPVKYSGISMEYTNDSDNMFVFNATLKYWATHRAVDLLADDGSEVVAMYDGTVIDVSESYGMGHTVTIDHGDSVIATYASLADVQVVKGQQVSKGDVIGAVSTSASYEFADGAHLHLEVTQNGNYVDPMPYVNGEVYREFEKEISK